MRIPILLATSLFIFAACAPTDDPEESPGPGPSPSGAFDLAVTYPERGAISQDATITVTGRVANSSPEAASIDVNGMVASVNGDGSFERSLPTPAGITLIETTAQNGNGDPITDTRAVLAGEFAAEGSAVANAVVARVGNETLQMLGDILAEISEEADLGALASPYNPVVDRGGSCLGAEADLIDAEFSDMSIDLQSTQGGLLAKVTVTNLFVDLVTNYRVACIAGTSPVQIRADSLTINGIIDLAVHDGSILARLRDAEAEFEGFDLTAPYLPVSIVEFFVDIDALVADALVGAIADLIPTGAQMFFADFSSGEITLPLLERDLWLGTRLVDAAFTSSGGTLVMEGQARVEDGIDGEFVRSPAPRPTSGQVGSTAGFSVALADDVVNQVLAAYWTSGGFEVSLSAEPGDQIANTLGDDVAQIIVEPLLPPMVSTNEASPNARITVGDILVHMKDANGALLARLAISGYVDIGAEATADGRIALAVGAPTVSLSILEDAALNLLEPQAEAVVALAVADIVSNLEAALQAVQIPSFGETTISTPDISVVNGYLVVTGNLSR